MNTNFEGLAISPFLEMGAYEALWFQPKTTFKSLSKQFARYPDCVPSDFVSSTDAAEFSALVMQKFNEGGVVRFGVQVHGGKDYPKQLRDAAYPVELLYYQGWWDLVYSRSIAVVGTRKPSKEGVLRTRRLVRALTADQFTIVSGLAAGIDRVAHETAINENGRTIAVIGTPLSYTYPKENRDLQRYIAEHFLLISQIPLQRYESQDYRLNRSFFPERNVTMSALAEATIIVEASEHSGTLTQAHAALQQGRKLFILDSCFQDSGLTWPAKFEKRGAIRVTCYNDIRQQFCA